MAAITLEVLFMCSPVAIPRVVSVCGQLTTTRPIPLSGGCQAATQQLYDKHEKAACHALLQP
jgi:hypothetical protein